MMLFKTNKCSDPRDNKNTLQQKKKEHNCLGFGIIQIKIWFLADMIRCCMMVILSVSHCSISFSNLSRSVALICYGTSIMLKIP